MFLRLVLALLPRTLGLSVVAGAIYVFVTIGWRRPASSSSCGLCRKCLIRVGIRFEGITAQAVLSVFRVMRHPDLY